MARADGISSSPRSPASQPPPARRARSLPRGRLLVAALVVLAGLALWKVPEWQVAPQRARLTATPDLAPNDRLLLDKELFQAENAARGTLAIILSAAGLLFGLGLAWRRLERLSGREARSQERFAQAVEQLASERADGSRRTETRLGGIYALERIATESATDYWPVMEVLTAYLRENAARSPATAERSPARPGADVQAIIGVLGRRNAAAPAGERRLLDLRDTDLRGANLSGARLEGVVLQGARLDGAEASRVSLGRANLREADLSAAVLSGADLQGAALARANLEGARLNGADLRGADLSGANLRGADFWQANLRGANLKDADLGGADLSQADLQEAILWRADLHEATLSGARLKDTHLERANLGGAAGLTWDQGKDAFTDENTVLPDYLLVGRTAAPGASPQPVAAEAAVTIPASAPRPHSRIVIAPAEPSPMPSSLSSVSALGSPGQPSPGLSSPEPAPAVNVVQLQEAIRPPAPTDESEPEPKRGGGKKLARPRRRHPSLVAPSRTA